MTNAHNVGQVSRLKPHQADEIAKGVDVPIDADGNIDQFTESIIDHHGPEKRSRYIVQFVEQTR